MKLRKVKIIGCACFLSLNVLATASPVYAAPSETSAAQNVTNKPRRAALMSASSVSYNTICLNWLALGNVTGYYVYRADEIDGNFVKIGQTDGKTGTYTDTNLKMGHRYYYKIAAFNNIEGTIVTGEQSFALNVIPNLAQVDGIKTKQKSYNKMKITWNETGGADGYVVYVSNKKDGDFKVAKRIGVTEVDDKKSDKKIKCKVTLSKLVTGKKYYVKVQACKVLNGKLKVGEESNVIEVKTGLDQVENLSVETGSYKSLSLKWDEVDGATSYQIFRSETADGEYESVAKVKENTYIDDELDTGSIYYYKVRAIRKSKKITAKGEKSDVGIGIPTLDIPDALESGNITSSTVQLKLKEVEGADGYYIERSKNADDGFEQIADYTDLEKMTYTDSGLEPKSTYYYRITAYKNAKEEGEEPIKSDSSVTMKIDTKKLVIKDIDIKAGTAVEYAVTRVGCNYVWGASGPSIFDCSGLVMWSYKKAGGRSLPHNAQAQYNCTSHISRADLQPGDLVFYGGSTSSINHVAIYIGGGKVVHAANPSSGVKISSIDSAGSSGAVGYSRV